MEEAPTYRVEMDNGQTRYVCIVADAGKPDGICGHYNLERESMATHQAQRHAGSMGEEHQAPPPVPPPPAPVESVQSPVSQDDDLPPEEDPHHE